MTDEELEINRQMCLMMGDVCSRCGAADGFDEYEKVLPLFHVDYRQMGVMRRICRVCRSVSETRVYFDVETYCAKRYEEEHGGKAREGHGFVSIIDLRESD